MSKWPRLVTLMVLLAGLLAWPAPASAATSMSIRWQLPSGGLYAIGIDHVLSNGTSPDGYEQFYEFPYSLYKNNPILPHPVSVYSAANLSEVRVEFYDRPTNPPGNYDPLEGDGAVAVRIPRIIPPNTPNTAPNLGLVTFPVPGGPSVANFFGDVVSRTPVTTGRVRIEIFQTTNQPLSSTGWPLDAFSANNSVGGSYTTGPLWNGQYIAFITDTVTARQAIGFMNLSGNTRLDLDLDIACFGIDECQFSGSVPPSQGEFHPVQPARLVDSRSGQGMPGSVSPGDGRNPDPNPNHRMQSRAGHEFVVTGLGGVPKSGVSAVLLNITVTSGSHWGTIRLIPKPPRSDVWQDQSSYPAGNYQAPAIYWDPWDTRASLQLVKVGVGGRVRVESYSMGHVHFIVDVVGWVDQGQPNQDGDRLLTVAPQRLLDTRDGTGGSTAPFGLTDTRQLDVAGAHGIPGDAKAVIGNLTATQSSGRSWQLVWPAGSSLPTASVLNTDTGRVRPNMVLSATGSGGNWSIYNSLGNTALIFDAVGYLTAASGSTGRITAVPSAVVQGGVARPANNDAPLRVVGTAGVPTSGVSAVFVLITVSSTTGTGWATAYPSGVTRPNVSNLNWTPGQMTANMALVPVGADGNIRIFNSQAANVTVSVLGWVN